MSEEDRIRKPNTIIQAGQNLTATQQNILFAMLHRFKYISEDIDPDLLAKQVYTFPISEVYQSYASARGGNVFDHVKSQVSHLVEQKLTERRVNHKGESTFTFIPIFGFAEISEGTSDIKVKFNQEVIPYMLNMVRDGYTSLVFKDVYELKTSYAKRIYELVSMQRTSPKTVAEGYFEITVPELRFKLGIEDSLYPRWFDFKKRVLDPSFEEINKKTVLRFSVDYNKSGRAISGLKFSNICLAVPIIDPINAQISNIAEQAVLDFTVEQGSLELPPAKPVVPINPHLVGILKKDQLRISENHTPEYIAHYHKKVVALESKGRLKSTFANCLFAYLESDEDDFYNRPKASTTVTAKQPSSEIERRLADRKKVEQESARMKDLEKLFVSLPVDIQQERIFAVKETMPLFSEEMARKQAILELAKEQNA